MPIHTPVKTRCLSQSEFGEISFEVMKHIFAIHGEFGRLFDEKIYKRELARRMPGVQLEVPVDVTYDSFAKRYFLDVLIGEGGLFEFKTVETLNARHRAQLAHYMMLLKIKHAKLVNMRPEKVAHDFVNLSRTLSELRQPLIEKRDWDRAIPGALQFEQTLLALVADWGTGLELPLYIEALTHFLGGESEACQDVLVLNGDYELGVQNLRLAAPNVAFKLTALSNNFAAHLVQTRKLLAYTSLKAMLWANINHQDVHFTCIR